PVFAGLLRPWLRAVFSCSGFLGLSGSIHLEQVAQLHARFVQLTSPRTVTRTPRFASETHPSLHRLNCGRISLKF
ncbi:MAG: hypothetical protein ACLQF0_02060, partial [Dissulfurispiraceae bacterium]